MYLRGRVKSGNPNRGLNFIGEGHDTEGSRELIRLVDAGTKDRPLNLSIWGGQTDLAQALFRVKKQRGSDGLATFVAKLRVYDIADQDGIADWMHDEFPGLYYILNKAPDGFDKRRATFRGMYLTGDESLTSRDWIDEHVRSKGPLGAFYPTKTWTAPNKHSCLKEGDTPSWFFFSATRRKRSRRSNETPAGVEGFSSRRTAGIETQKSPMNSTRGRLSADSGLRFKLTLPNGCVGASSSFKAYSTTSVILKKQQGP